jgi:hypothetical protein
MKVLGKFVPKEDNPYEEFEVIEQWPMCKIGDEVSERGGKKVSGELYHVFTKFWEWVEY